MARVREELLQMDDEVKRRRKEREQQAVEQRQAQDRNRKMEQDNKHLLANLFNQKPMLNQSLAQTLAQSQSQLLKQKLNDNAQRRQSLSGSQLQRLQAQAKSALQLPSKNVPLLSLQRNPGQSQQRTHNSWPNTSASTNQASNTASIRSNFSQFFSQSFAPPFQQRKNASLQQTPLPPSLSSKNSLDDILDLTMGSPSISPDTTDGGLNLESLAGHAAFTDDFNLESLISQTASNAQQQAAQIQQPLLLQQQQQIQQQQIQQHQQQQQQQHLQQRSQNLLASNHQDLLDLFDLPLSPQMPTQKASPSSSTSSCSSSASSTSNNLVPHASAGLPPASSLLPTPSPSSLFSSPSPSSSLFSNSSPRFSSNYLLPQSDSLSLPNGHPGTLDAREALNIMLQEAADRKSVIKYRPPELE